MDLATLLSPIAVPVFLDQYFTHTFLRVPGRPEKFSRLVPAPENPDGYLPEPLAILALDIERMLEAPVRVSPAGLVAPHRRDRDGILLQLSGESDCKIEGNASEPVDPPVWEGRLHAGDMLYIPRGWWMSATPGGTHLAFEIENPTGADLLRWLVEHARKHPEFQSDVPRFADPATKAEYISGFRKTLGRFLRGPGLLETFRRETNFAAAPRPASGIPWSENAPDDHWIAFLSPRKIRIKRANDQTLLLVTMGKRLAFSPDAAPLLHYLSDRAPVPVGEFYKAFEGDFDRAEISDLLAALSKDGIIGLRAAHSI